MVVVIEVMLERVHGAQDKLVCSLSASADFVSLVERVPDHEGDELDADGVDKGNKKEGSWDERLAGGSTSMPGSRVGGVVDRVNGDDERPVHTAAQSGGYMEKDEARRRRNGLVVRYVFRWRRGRTDLLGLVKVSCSSSFESCSSSLTCSSDSVHLRRSLAMYSLKAAQPTITVPPSHTRRRLASVSPRQMRGAQTVEGHNDEATRGAEECEERERGEGPAGEGDNLDDQKKKPPTYL